MNDDVVAEGEEPHAGEIPEASRVAHQAQPYLAPRQGHGMQTRSKLTNSDAQKSLLMELTSLAHRPPR